MTISKRVSEFLKIVVFSVKSASIQVSHRVCGQFVAHFVQVGHNNFGKKVPSHH